MVQAIEQIKPLSELATLINKAHWDIVNKQRLMLAGISNYLHAKREIGDYLLQAKSQLAHGQWLPWLSENCTDIAQRTAHDYMYVAKNWDKIAYAVDQAAKIAESANLGISKAIELIRTSTPSKEEGEIVDGELVEEPEDEDEGDGVALLSTSKAKAKSGGKSDNIENRYKPLVGDICRIKPSSNGRSQDFGREVEVIKVESEVLAYFRFLDDGTEGVLMNVQLELIHRPTSDTDTIPVANSDEKKDLPSSAKRYNLSTLDELMDFRSVIREFIQSKERTLEFLDEKSVKMLKKHLPGMTLIAVEPELLEKAQALIGE